MKSMILNIALMLLSTAVFAQSQTKITGAWQLKQGDDIQTLIMTDQFYALTHYNLDGKKFISTRGGSWKMNGGKISFLEEFNTEKKDGIGTEKSASIKVTGETMTVDVTGKGQKWTRLDAGEPGKLAGAWLITGRMVENNMQKMTPGARRTMKILSGTRFQWIAYNTETKEFFGTGGGTYTTKDGKYTENIEFFSRDNSRVGQSLQFDFSLEEGKWRHKGLSSKGDPIDEIWTRREQLGI